MGWRRAFFPVVIPGKRSATRGPAARDMIADDISNRGETRMRLHTMTWMEVDAYLKEQNGIIVPIGST